MLLKGAKNVNKTIRLAFLTDLHLNFLSEQGINHFCLSQVLSESPDLLVITGDISEAPILKEHLRSLSKGLGDNLPIFFVCGNHDYYNGSIADLRQELTLDHCYPDYEKEPGNLYKGTWWLGGSGVVPLTEKAALVGHDGWYDGWYANFMQSRLDMNDYYIIKELKQHKINKGLLLQECRNQATISANYVREQMESAFTQGFETVYVATHVPPFKENSTYNGKISDDDWLPSFSSKIMGDTILDVMLKYPEKHCIVLCGHSHGGAYHRPLKNVECYTGEATYGHPSIAEIFIVE